MSAPPFQRQVSDEITDSEDVRNPTSPSKDKDKATDKPLSPSSHHDPHSNKDHLPHDHLSHSHAPPSNDPHHQPASAAATDDAGGVLSDFVRHPERHQAPLKQDQKFAFWSTQPVPSLNSSISNEESGPIETKTLSEVMAAPYPLPDQFEWDSIDMKDEKQVNEVYTLLFENYVEDDDNMFRFDYSRDFLKWALQPPGYLREWHVGVRAKTNRKLFAFISAIPATMRVYKSKVPMVEINFLCVHKKLRSKRLAPVLIKEITRRVNLTDVWQAVYTAGVVLPKPVAQNRYYHRSLNPKKLIDVKFSRLHPRMTIARTVKLYKLPDKPVLSGIREMKEADVPQVAALVNQYLHKFQLAAEFTENDVRHWLLPRAGVVYCYVVEAQQSGKLTDFCSFYNLPSTIMGHEKYTLLKAAYSFYNVSTKTPLVDLMNDALIFAKNNEFDVFNALNVMDNEEFLAKLKFGIGDGNLQYYLFNWKCPEMKPSQVGLVLL